MAARPIKSLELHYSMIQFLIIKLEWNMRGDINKSVTMITSYSLQNTYVARTNDTLLLSCSEQGRL